MFVPCDHAQAQPVQAEPVQAKSPSDGVVTTLLTPDGRYIVVRGRLWRASNPDLPPDVRERLTRDLMAARRAVARALKAHDPAGLQAARRAVHAAKVALGERGPVWWSDAAADYNRRLVRNTPYADWFAAAFRP